MKKLMLMAVAATAFAGTMATAPTADAAQGCGRGYHRGPAGHCRPNAGRYAGGPVLVIGRFYNGRGYWDGRRYYQHRERWHNGWRYR